VNLPLYGPAVTHVFGLDPSPELLRLASRRAADVVIPVSLLRALPKERHNANLNTAVFDREGMASEAKNTWPSGIFLQSRKGLGTARRG
jgi:hypothetical protein